MALDDDDIRDGWQFRFVTEFGPTTGRVDAVGNDVPLRIRRENLPIGADSGTLSNPLVITDPYLRVEFGAPADLPGYTWTGKIKIFRKSSEFSRDITDVTNALAIEIVDLDLSAVLVVAALGSITTVPVSSLVDGDTFALDDGTNIPTTFEYDVSGTNVPAPGNIEIDVSADVTADNVRDTTLGIINGIGASLLITASNGGAATVALANDVAGEIGNQSIVESVIDVGFIVSGMAGGSTLSRSEYLEDEFVLDQGTLGNPGDIWYYTVFYEFIVDAIAADQWVFSPSNSHARNWANVNDLDSNSDPTSRIGTQMFELMSRSVKIADFTEAGNATFRLMQALGRIFDGIREEINQHLTKVYDADNVDAGRLPYIDWLLAWPTNFELSEEKRRIETKQAVELWKAKGTKAALELALQTVTNYDVTVIEGWKWVTTAWDGKPLLDAGSPPVGWVDGIDGVWVDLVNALPDNTAYDANNPNHKIRRGTRQDGLCRAYSSEIIVETGVGWWWQNLNGILILLTEIPGVSGRLTETLVRKVYRITPLFAMHYAAFAVMIEQLTEEAWKPLGIDSVLSTLDYLIEEDDYLLLDDSSEFVLDQGDLCLMHAYPHPTKPNDANANNPQFLAYHSFLQLDCTIP